MDLTCDGQRQLEGHADAAAVTCRIRRSPRISCGRFRCASRSRDRRTSRLEQCTVLDDRDRRARAAGVSDAGSRQPATMATFTRSSTSRRSRRFAITRWDKLTRDERIAIYGDVAMYAPQRATDDDAVVVVRTQARDTITMIASSSSRSAICRPMAERSGCRASCARDSDRPVGRRRARRCAGSTRSSRRRPASCRTATSGVNAEALHDDLIDLALVALARARCRGEEARHALSRAAVPRSSTPVDARRGECRCRRSRRKLRADLETEHDVVIHSTSGRGAVAAARSDPTPSDARVDRRRSEAVGRGRRGVCGGSAAKRSAPTTKRICARTSTRS